MRFGASDVYHTCGERLEGGGRRGRSRRRRGRLHGGRRRLLRRRGGLTLALAHGDTQREREQGAANLVSTPAMANGSESDREAASVGTWERWSSRAGGTTKPEENLDPSSTRVGAPHGPIVRRFGSWGGTGPGTQWASCHSAHERDGLPFVTGPHSVTRGLRPLTPLFP